MAHLSDSKVQIIAEKLILRGLETQLRIPSGSLKTKRIMLDKKSRRDGSFYSTKQEEPSLLLTQLPNKPSNIDIEQQLL